MTTTVLIVDDDPTLVEVLTLVLKRGGFVPRAASDGLQAIQALDTELADAIILDIMLPDMDGFEVCRRIRGNPKTAEIPILMLSARTQITDRLSGFEAGADDYVPKPADPKEILARLRALLNRAQRRPPQPKPVVTFVGVKGGVGTTTVALNVALALVAEGHRVILLELSSIGIAAPWLLALTPSQNLLGLSALPGLQLTMAALQTAIVVHPSGLHYLAGQDHQVGPLRYPQGFLGETVRLLQEQYEVVIIDLGVSALSMATEALVQSSIILPVTELESVALWHLPALMNWLQRNKLEKVPGLVLVDRTYGVSKESPSAIASRLRLGIVAVIPPAPETLYHAHARQEPLFLADPHGEASLALAALGRQLLAPRLEIAPDLRP